VRWRGYLDAELRNTLDDEACVLDLNDFFYFVQVVDRGGFTAAGRTLRVPKSTLSHRIQQLETNLGVRLLNRTSRRFGMTDAGGEFYRHAANTPRIYLDIDRDKAQVLGLPSNWSART